ncbi:MAG: hypothetical protein IPH20_20300 [Bacteroidales bacterium]|nr:hypothetical protein [Bacteroidales bacterium]
MILNNTVNRPVLRQIGSNGYPCLPLIGTFQQVWPEIIAFDVVKGSKNNIFIKL